MKKFSAKRQRKWKPLKEVGTGWQKWLPVLLILGIVLVNIKKMFADFNVDVEYAVTMSYRLAKGDHMFSQMREPHQTSAFLLAFFVKIWIWATGTTTGLVLYLNAVSLVAKLLVVLFFYCTLKRYCDYNAAFLASCFLAISNAKTYVILDFSNMQIYSAILLFCCLSRYFEEQHRKWLALSALCHCLEILSYPSCLLVYFIIIGLLLCMSRERLKDCLLFSTICGILGISYTAFFGFRLGWADFLLYIQEILTGDNSHALGIAGRFTGYGNAIGYAAEIMRLLLLYGVCASLSCLITLSVWFIRKKAMRIKKVSALLWCASFFTLLGIFDLLCIIATYDDFAWAEGYFPLMLLGIFLLRFCNKSEQRLFWLGTWLGLGCMSAVLLLTNLSFATTMAYLIPAVAMTFIPIGRGLQAMRWNALIPLYIFLALTLFRNFYTFMPMSFYYKNIFLIGNIVRSGPALGIVSDYMGPYIMNSDIQEWPQHIEPGDRLLVVSESGGVSTLPYLYEDVEISAASTICTPTYNEKLLRYWEQNPDKFPNVVVVDCWFGHLNVDEDSWIMQWIYEEFGADSFEDGAYTRYYRRGTMGYGKGTNQ